MKINPNDPAYPVVLAPHDGRDGTEQHYERGIPIRLEIAARLMAGAASRPEILSECKEARIALLGADALIAAYNASEP